MHTHLRCWIGFLIQNLIVCIATFSEKWPISRFLYIVVEKLYMNIHEVSYWIITYPSECSLRTNTQIFGVIGKQWKNRHLQIEKFESHIEKKMLPYHMDILQIEPDVTFSCENSDKLIGKPCIRFTCNMCYIKYIYITLYVRILGSMFLCWDKYVDIYYYKLIVCLEIHFIQNYVCFSYVMISTCTLCEIFL